MKGTPAFSGSVVQTRRPDWAPLEATVGTLAGWFMWMHEVSLTPSMRLHAYKHVTTRQYLYLSVTLRAFERRAGDLYAEIPPAIALSRAFSGWQYAEPESDDVRAFRSALESARLAVDARRVPGLQMTKRE